MKLGSWKAIIFLGAFIGANLFGSAFYLLWVRNDISSDAKSIASLEYKLLKAQDALRSIEIKVDDSIQPHVLRSRVESFLSLPYEGQVIRVQSSPESALVHLQWIDSVSLISGKEGV